MTYLTRSQGPRDLSTAPRARSTYENTPSVNGLKVVCLLLREKVARAQRVTDEELIKALININTSSTINGPPSPTGEGFFCIFFLIGRAFFEPRGDSLYKKSAVRDAFARSRQPNLFILL
jgi:hypothetical protein